MPQGLFLRKYCPIVKLLSEFYSKDASKITVSGEWQSGFNAVETLVRNDTGLFILTVGPLKPELYGYTFTVDGVRTIDPNNVQVRRDGVELSELLYYSRS